MSLPLPLLKWSEEIFNDLVKSFKFPLSWGAIYPQEGQTTAQAPAGYITLFWNYFAEGNFRLPATKFVLEVLGYYKFHIYQLNPMGMTLETKIWYQDIKDVLSVELHEKDLVAAKMYLHWKADRHDKPVYVEDDKIIALYVVAYKRENGKMSTVQKGADEETWYRRIVKNFTLPKDADLNAQPSSGVADAPKADILKEEKKKGTYPVFDTWCDYVVVSDSLEGLAPVSVKYPKAEPQDTVDILPSKPEEPIDLESSPEPLVRTKAIKRKKPECEAAAQPAKKILRKMISKRGNLDTLATKLSPGKCLFLVPIII
ncbi:hypothetical protein Hanom_Chr15g01390181 [Helianthus anomalus]